MKKVLGIAKYLVFISIFFALLFGVQDILKEQENYYEELKNKVVLISHVY